MSASARTVRRGVAAFALLLWTAGAWPAEEPLKSLLMLEFELIDETRPRHAPARSPEQKRLEMISAQLRAEFERKRFYALLDPARGAPAIERARASHRYLHDCNGCELDLARGLGAERVLTGWVQKVSELILNLNFEIKDTATGGTVLRKSVDIRGNTDETWSRGIAFLVRDMGEKQQGGK